MIYLDSSAVVKLVRREAHTEDLSAWLAERGDASLVSSALVEVEVPRALRRHAPQDLPAVPAVLAALYRVDIDADVRARAGAYTDAGLRALDAIHLATASTLAADHDGFAALVAYDRRLLEAARSIAVPTASPGTDLA